MDLLFLLAESAEDAVSSGTESATFIFMVVAGIALVISKLKK